MDAKVHFQWQVDTFDLRHLESGPLLNFEPIESFVQNTTTFLNFRQFHWDPISHKSLPYFDTFELRNLEIAPLLN